MYYSGPLILDCYILYSIHLIILGEKCLIAFGLTDQLTDLTKYLYTLAQYQ